MTIITIPAEKFVGGDVHDISPEGIDKVKHGLWRWQIDQFPDRHGGDLIEDLRLGVFEELGELAHALLKRRQKIRGMHDRASFEVKRDDAIGDALVYFANLESALANTSFHEEGDKVALFGAYEGASTWLWLGADPFTSWKHLINTLRKAARVSEAHVLLCFCETAAKVMRRTDRTETRDPV
jgi:NTP pyrophosphatase (non-canonical NTP hydrolase)